jgi:hypothetical protein
MLTIAEALFVVWSADTSVSSVQSESFGEYGASVMLE